MVMTPQPEGMRRKKRPQVGDSGTVEYDIEARKPAIDSDTWKVIGYTQSQPKGNKKSAHAWKAFSGVTDRVVWPTEHGNHTQAMVALRGVWNGEGTDAAEPPEAAEPASSPTPAPDAVATASTDVPAAGETAPDEPQPETMTEIAVEEDTGGDGEVEVVIVEETAEGGAEPVPSGAPASGAEEPAAASPAPQPGWSAGYPEPSPVPVSPAAQEVPNPFNDPFAVDPWGGTSSPF
jgi:hypothetical protein